MSNLQESYDSLLKTAHQIKARLDNSLLKFKEYEDTLESIWSNLDELESTIKTDVDMPQDLGKAKILMESMRVSGLFLMNNIESLTPLFCPCDIFLSYCITNFKEKKPDLLWQFKIVKLLLHVYPDPAVLPEIYRFQFMKRRWPLD